VESLVILYPRARRFAGGTMWTTKNRARYERKGLRYESDLTDEEYTLIENVAFPAALSSMAFCTY
jgi:hypothetical protein